MPRGFGELAASLAHLEAQTRRDAIEVVLVHTPRNAGEVDARRFEGFRGFRAVEVPRIPAVASAFVAACAVATGDVIALVEDHVMLDRRWAEATLDAHGHDCAAVSPVMSNGNPATSISWANFVSSFHDAIGAAVPGPVACGPGHNTSYKRGVLLRYGTALESLYQSERSFHYRLQQDGHVIWHAPDARLAHLNISRGWHAVRHSWLGGAMFGQYRSKNMKRGERVLRTLGAPLVPLVRFRRIRHAVRTADVAMRPGAWGLLWLMLGGHAMGEAVGYWMLVRGIEARYEFFELHRLECLRADERRLMTGA